MFCAEENCRKSKSNIYISSFKGAFSVVPTGKNVSPIANEKLLCV
jgi:hypothetical protein